MPAMLVNVGFRNSPFSLSLNASCAFAMLETVRFY